MTMKPIALFCSLILLECKLLNWLTQRIVGFLFQFKGISQVATVRGLLYPWRRSCSLAYFARWCSARMRPGFNHWVNDRLSGGMCRTTQDSNAWWTYFRFMISCRDFGWTVREQDVQLSLHTRLRGQRSIANWLCRYGKKSITIELLHFLQVLQFGWYGSNRFYCESELYTNGTMLPNEYCMCFRAFAM